MPKHLIASLLLTAASLSSAWPAVAQLSAALQKRAEPPPRQPMGRLDRPNTGLPPSGFNAEDQYVDVSPGSKHEFRPPGPSDKRGQCPGLNAAANHGFIGRDGMSTITEAIEGLGAAYNMGPDLSAFLAILGVGLAGDPVLQRWSIGDAFTPSVPLFPARGILGTHNKYEGDASIFRGDAYLNDGSPGVFQLRSFEHMYSLGETFGFNEAAAQSDYVTRWSIMNNPYYFSAPFSGLVAPAAHNLVINLMSNHSAEVPGGTLTRDTLKSFMSVVGEPGSFEQVRGHERIPDNWYRRPTLDAHNIPEVLVDLFLNNGIYPGIVRIGGNTGKVNTFTGVDLQNLTNGAYNLETLSQGNNGACFLLQASLAELPDAADPALGAVGSVSGWVTEQLGPTAEKLGCPQLSSFENTLFNSFPGAGYTGTDL